MGIGYWAGAAAALAAAVGVLPAKANDSTAELTTGGLVFKTTANIEMRSEDLFISRDRVTVRYRFFNRASADETVTVAFPMPDVTFGIDAMNSIPDPDSDNFLDFRTQVDGKAVTATLDQRAFVNAKDVTSQLTGLKIPLMQGSDAAQKALDRLDAATQKQLTAAEIAIDDDYDAGKGMEHHLAAGWTLKSIYYWQQTFPAQKDIIVEHSYRPSVGSTVQAVLYTVENPELKAQYDRLYCPDKAFVAGIKAMVQKGADGSVVPPEYRLGYVLKTGANWAGPIGDFHLTVDKGNPKALISFCETGVQKTGPTTFEVRHANFTPTQDLNFLIVEMPQP